MRTPLLICLLTLFCQLLVAQQLYFPPDHNQGEWETTPPEELGFRADRIQELYDFLDENQTKSFMLLKDGKIVLEQYFGSYTADSLWFWNSAGKSLRATMFGQAVEEGWLSLDDVSSDYLGTGWSSLTPEQESAITVLNHLTMTTGMDDTVPDCLDPECFQYLVPPDERWFYDNPPYSISKDILEASTASTINAYTNTRIEDPLGMRNGFWLNLGANNTIYLSRARDMARFGLMIQADGQWDGEEIVDSAHVHLMTQPSQDLNPSYGILWWLNGQESYIPPGFGFSINGPLSVAAPQDMVMAAGAFGQFISISKEEGLIMIRQGTLDDLSLAPIFFHNQIWELIALLDEAPNSTTDAQLEGVAVFPNPAIEIVRVSGLPASGADLKLRSLDGSILAERSGVAEFPMGQFPSGVYVLEVSAAEGTRHFRIVH
ncbi:MAG: serine hydrolase [Bacteroidota bacterium]